MDNQIPLNITDKGYFLALRDSINTAQSKIVRESEFQLGAISSFNDVLDMIERILQNATIKPE